MELVGKIYITDNYDKFQKLKGNRILKKNIGLEKSIAKSGILIPIEVNEHFEILDGQNRFELARKLNKPIPYRIVEGFGMEEVIDLNSTTKSWTVRDYINKYLIDQNEEYQKLNELSMKYDRIPISSLVASAEGYLKLNSKSQKNIREGRFCFCNYEMFCLLLADYQLFLTKTGVKSGQFTFFAFMNLYTIEVFDFERLVNGIIDKVNLVNGNNNLDVVTELFLEAHNRNLRDDSDLAIHYNINKKNKPEILSRRNTILLNTEA